MYTIHAIFYLYIIYILVLFQAHTYVISFHQDSIYIAHTYHLFQPRHRCYHVFRLSHVNFISYFLVGLSHKLHVGQ